MAVALGAPIGGLIAGLLGWRGTYAFIALLGLVAAGAIFAMLPGDLRGEKRTLRERLAVLSLPGVVPALLTTMFAVAGPFTVFIYIAPLATKGAGLDLAWLPAVTLAFGIGAAIGNTVGGQLGDRIGATVTATALLSSRRFFSLSTSAPIDSPETFSRSKVVRAEVSPIFESWLYCSESVYTFKPSCISICTLPLHCRRPVF